MRRREPEVGPVDLLFHGRRYASVGERRAAEVAWRERRRRLLALLGYDEHGWPTALRDRS